MYSNLRWYVPQNMFLLHEYGIRVLRTKAFQRICTELTLFVLGYVAVRFDSVQIGASSGCLGNCGPCARRPGKINPAGRWWSISILHVGSRLTQPYLALALTRLGL